MLRLFLGILRRDVLLAYRQRSELLNPMLFFVLVIVVFQLALGAERALLTSLAPAIVWVAALLATLLSLDAMFRSDMEDGTLEQMIISTQPTSIMVLAKIIAHWFTTGLIVSFVGPVLSLMLGLSFSATKVLFLTLILGTPVLSAIGSIGVALTVGLRRGGMLLALLVLPLYIPVLIFASQSVMNYAAGYPIGAAISLLLGILLLSLSLSPLATAAALRVSIN